MGGGLVPWIPRPKLIPERDGMYGASGETHLRVEVSGACRGPSFVLEALWCSGRVHIYRDRWFLITPAVRAPCDYTVWFLGFLTHVNIAVLWQKRFRFCVLYPYITRSPPLAGVGAAGAGAGAAHRCSACAPARAKG